MKTLGKSRTLGNMHGPPRHNPLFAELSGDALSVRRFLHKPAETEAGIAEKPEKTFFL